MRSTVLFNMGLVSLIWSMTGTAYAQESVVTEPPEVKIEVANPQLEPQASMTWQEYELSELKNSARRSRNALIGLTASAAVGAAFLFPGLVRQCVLITDINNQDELRCSRSGKALVGVGYPLFIGGTIGMLVSGIMLGVRNGKIRRLERRIASEKAGAFRWDAARASFVF